MLWFHLNFYLDSVVRIMISPTILRLNLTPPSGDVILRIIGSTGVIIAYFIVLHVNVALGVALHFIADLISIPYFIKTKSWDVVIMLSFLLTISLSKLL